MALSDRLKSAPTRTPGTPCSVGAVEDHLSGGELDAFHAMLHNGHPATGIYRAVQDEARELLDAGDLDGASVLSRLSLQQINRHRSRSCRCFKAAA